MFAEESKEKQQETTKNVVKVASKDEDMAASTLYDNCYNWNTLLK